MKKLHASLLPMLIAASLVSAGCQEQPEPAEEQTADTMDHSDGMPGMAMGEDYVPDSLSSMKLAPLVKAYYEGDEIYFIHTEVSDPQVGSMLTEMMGPEVVVVAGLAEAPEAILADIYVFKNGVQGQGPFGYQPDVFDSVPGEDGYSPLRVISEVSWTADVTPRELRTVEAIQEAERQGEVAIEKSGIVVNAPVLAWGSGHR